MSLIFPAGLTSNAKEREEKEKKDMDTVARLLVNTDLPPARIAEIAGTSIEFVHQANEKIQR